jgi:hypothetical protein
MKTCNHVNQIGFRLQFNAENVYLNFIGYITSSARKNVAVITFMSLTGLEIIIPDEEFLEGKNCFFCIFFAELSRLFL